MKLPAAYISTSERLPGIGEEVKLIITCSSWHRTARETTTGWLESNNGEPVFFTRGYSGACIKVLGWAPLKEKTNISTETL